LAVSLHWNSEFRAHADSKGISIFDLGAVRYPNAVCFIVDAAAYTVSVDLDDRQVGLRSASAEDHTALEVRDDIQSTILVDTAGDWAGLRLGRLWVEDRHLYATARLRGMEAGRLPDCVDDTSPDQWGYVETKPIKVGWAPSGVQVDRKVATRHISLLDRIRSAV